MVMVLLTEDARHSLSNQAITILVIMSVVASAYLIMLIASFFYKVIGEGGASIISRVMGMILTSIAATNVLEGIKEYFL